VNSSAIGVADYTTTYMSRDGWEEALPQIDKELGMASQSKFAGHAYLPALAAEELERTPERAASGFSALQPEDQHQSG